MTEYFCECCNYKTKIKTHFIKHLATKKHRKNMGNKDDDIMNEKKFIIGPSKTLNFPHFPLKNPQKLSAILVSFVVRNFQDPII